MNEVNSTEVSLNGIAKHAHTPPSWLAQTLFCARIDTDGRLRPISGLSAKLTAAARNTEAPLVRHVVVAADQPGLDGHLVRLEGARPLRLIRAQTMSEAFEALERAYRTEEIAGHVHRPWAEKYLQQMVAERDHGYVVLIGKAGAGKTALMRRLLSEGVLDDDGSCWTLAAHFVRRGGPSDAPQVLIAELIARIRAEVGATDGGKPGELEREFESMLKRAANLAAQYGKRCILVVDGIDEVFGRRRRSAGEFGRFFPLADQLPKGVVIVLTSRPDEDYLLEHLAGAGVRRFDLSQHHDACNADVSAFLRLQANHLDGAQHERLVARLAGNFALTHCLLEEARHHPEALERWATDPGAFPASIDEWLNQQWMSMERAALGRSLSPDGLLAVLGLIVLAARDLSRIELENVLTALRLPNSPLNKLPSPHDSPLHGCLTGVDLSAVLELVSPILAAGNGVAHLRESDRLRLVNIAFDDWIEQRLDARCWRGALHAVLAWACSFHADGRFAALQGYALHALVFHLIFAGHARLACSVLHGKKSDYALRRARATARLLATTGANAGDAAERLHQLAEWAVHDDYLVQALAQELTARRTRISAATCSATGKERKRIDKLAGKLARARAGAEASRQHLAYFIHEHGYRVVDVARSSGYALPGAESDTGGTPQSAPLSAFPLT